jgi:hypothetical protein
MVDAVRLHGESKRVYDETRRRQRELDLREARLQALEQERSRYEPPADYEQMSPEGRKILERFERIEKRFDQADNIAREAEERRAALADQTSRLQSGYESIMRGVPTQNRVDENKFFNAMEELYPNQMGALPAGLSPERAVQNVAKFLGLSQVGGGFGNGSYTRSMTRDPRATIVIPGGSTSSPTTSSEPDASPQRPGETIEQYSHRISLAGQLMQQRLREAGVRTLPERYSSG